MENSFELGKFKEEDLENAFIELFEKQGYKYTSGETIERRSYKEVLIYEDLVNYLKGKYSDLTELEVQRVISILDNIPAVPLYDGNKETYLKVSEGFDLIRDDLSKTALHIDYIDFSENGIENNIFRIVNQYTVEGDNTLRRPDLLVYINGIPVVIFELKTAIREDKTIYDAWKQIHIRYCRDIPRLLKYSILSVISDGVNTKMGSIFSKYKFYYSWNKANDQEKVSNGISSLLTMMKGVFAKDRLLKIIRDFVFYPDNSKKNEAIVCRYPQFFGANKMLESLKNNKRPEGNGKGGIYFGATGSGKTYLMLYLSRLLMLREKEKFNNPTIIIITDREDLDSQTASLFVTAKRYLHDDNVRSIESREDLANTLKNQESGGVYITTIQKFCESTGLLSKRNNIICISDEAHRTQTGVGSKLKITKDGIETTYGFAYYLRESLPNAVCCGVTGTPIDESIAVFGDVVDKYTMKESSDDGITVRISYEPRLVRVLLSEEDAKDIQKYYEKCEEQGSNPEQIRESQKAMSKMKVILEHPERLKKLANDIVCHYETLCEEKPSIVQKAMIVCADRNVAFKLYKGIVAIRSEWGIAKKCENLDKFTKEELEQLVDVPKINLVATRGDNDEKELYDICGTKEYRKFLDGQFKNTNSNFKIAIVVDMWITGFDVPSLSVMYIDKPLQRHTLIQTVSRVNRLFEGKEKGIIVDYIGIKEEMKLAMKMYGGEQESPIDEIGTTLEIFRNDLKLIDDLVINFEASNFFKGSPLERLECLNLAVEYIQRVKDIETRFMALTRRLKMAYTILFPTGELTKKEVTKAQFYLAIRSIIYKQTNGNVPDAEIMNSVVEEMVRKAISTTGVENIFDDDKAIDIFSADFKKQVNSIKGSITRFKALLKLIRKAISSYGKVNRIKAIEFDKRLKQVVERYNNRDKLVFVSEVVEDFVNNLSDELLVLIDDLNEDKTSFEKLGISYEEKAFYDILVKVRDEHNFIFEDEKCIVLAKEIKKLIDGKREYVDFLKRDDIRNELNQNLTVLLYRSGYPPQWDDEVFDKVMEQTENFKKFN